jgi:hypothetical protein
MSLKINLGVNADPKNLQLLAKSQITKIVEKLEKLHNKNFDLILNEYKNFGTPCESESQILSLIMKHILNLYQFAIHNENFSGLVIPEPHTIKLKWIQSLKAQWSSKGKVSGRYFFLNGSNIQSYKTEQLLRLCIHEVIPGHIMFRLNTNSFIKSYFDKNKSKKSIRKMIKSGSKAVNEGFASYIEKILLQIDPSIESMTMLLFNKLFHALRMFIDVGLNSSNATWKFNKESAFSALKSFTILTDQGIEAEINKYYANPGVACSYCFGNCYYEVLENIYNKHGHNDFYKDMYTLQLPFPIIFRYVDQKINPDNQKI